MKTTHSLINDDTVCDEKNIKLFLEKILCSVPPEESVKLEPMASTDYLVKGCGITFVEQGAVHVPRLWGCLEKGFEIFEL